MIRFDERTDRPTIPHIVADAYYGELENWEHVQRSAREWIDYQLEGVEADEQCVEIRLGDTVYGELDVNFRPARKDWNPSPNVCIKGAPSRVTIRWPMVNPYRWEDVPADLCEGRTVYVEVDDTTERTALRAVGHLLANAKPKALFYSDARNQRAWMLNIETLEITNLIGLENEQHRQQLSARLCDFVEESRFLADDQKLSVVL